MKGKGLFVFSDPGGAKPVLALVSSIMSKLDDFRIVSDRHYPFIKDFELTVSTNYSDVEHNFLLFNPDFLFTGTSYTSKIELDYISCARKKGVSSYAFVDHWTCIRERFLKNGKEILPDHICVVDSKAMEIGIAEGISKEMFCIIGNPFHEYLKNWRPSVQRNIFFNRLSINTANKKIIVFAPDPLSNVNGHERFGFDEILVTDELSSMMEDINKSSQIVFKPHPNQDISKISTSFLSRVYVADQYIDNNLLIFYSDIIIGFFSNYLIEAKILGKKVIRYLPSNCREDPFKELNIGLIANRDTLLEYLK